MGCYSFSILTPAVKGNDCRRYRFLSLCMCVRLCAVFLISVLSVSVFSVAAPLITEKAIYQRKTIYKQKTRLTLSSHMDQNWFSASACSLMICDVVWLYNYLYIFAYEWCRPAVIRTELWPAALLTPCCNTGMMSHPPIPISELAEHIELLKANDNLRLSQEYEVREALSFHINKKITFLLFKDVRPVKSSYLCKYVHDLFRSAIYSLLHYSSWSFHYLQMHC